MDKGLEDTLRSMDPEVLKALYPDDYQEILQILNQSLSPDGGQPRQPKHLPAPFDAARHARKCFVCSHPQREAIEHDFLHWRSPDKLVQDYGIPHRSMIYRHLHAQDLFRKRTGLIRHALESIIERSEDCRVTANSVIRAIRAYSCLSDDGRWIDPPIAAEPPKQVIRSSARQPTPQDENLIETPAIRNPANSLKTKCHENS